MTRDVFMAYLLGKKIGMTRTYDESGRITPVTVLQAGPCTVLQVKTAETDGYCAVQLGFEDVKAGRVKKPAAGHAAKANTVPKRFVREWRLGGDEAVGLEPGQAVSVEVFEGVKYVDVSGTSKGKGYAGVMKRHGFGGLPASHGTERKHRAPGSIGGHASDHGTERKHRAPGSIGGHASDCGHGGNLKKGKRMSGRMGGVRVTSKNHRLLYIDAEKHLLVVKGAVPGPAGGYVEIRTAKTHRQAAKT